MTQDNGKAHQNEPDSRPDASDANQGLHYWERNRLIRGVRLKCNLKAVLQEINDQKDLDHFKPTLESIAECAGLSARRALDAMKRLREMRLVETTPTQKFGGGRGPNEYDIDFDQLARQPMVKFGRYKRAKRSRQVTLSLFPDERPDETSGLQDLTTCQSAPTERPDESSGPQDVTKRPGANGERPDETSRPQDLTNRPGFLADRAKEAAAADLYSRLVRLGIFRSSATEFVETLPHDYLAKVIQEAELYAKPRGLGADAIATIIRRREHIAPPHHKPTKGELAERKQHARREAERAEWQRKRESEDQALADEAALGELFDERPERERLEIRANVMARNPMAAELPEGSELVRKLCLAEFAKQVAP